MILHILLTAVLALAAVALMFPISPLISAMFLNVLLFVTFGGPGLLIWAQRYKK